MSDEIKKKFDEIYNTDGWKRDKTREESITYLGFETGHKSRDEEVRDLQEQIVYLKADGVHTKNKKLRESMEDAIDYLEHYTYSHVTRSCIIDNLKQALKDGN